MLLAFCCAAVAYGQLGRYSLDFSLSEKNFVDTIAIEYENNQVYVPVNVGGRQMRFLLDTGAGQAVVYTDTPEFSGLVLAGEIISHDAVGQSDTVRLVKLPPMQLGRLVLKGCQATLQRRHVRRHRCDGILGFDLVNKGLQMKIDALNRLLILTDRKNFFRNEPGCRMRYKLSYHVPRVAVSPFGSFQEEVLFDTGSRGLYAINKQSFDQGVSKVGLLAESQVEGRSQGRHAIGFSGPEPLGEVVFLNLQQLRLGDFTFREVHTLTTQGGSHLGARVLDYGAVVFMPRRKQLLFQPYGTENEARVANRQMEIAFVQENGMPVVGLVWPGGEPYSRGFREGDLIVSIDGRAVNSFGQFLTWGFERGREYRFTVRDRRGFTREVRWVRLSAKEEKQEGK